MAELTSRWYRSPDDLTRMLELATASAIADGVSYGHLHAGDVVWGLFANETIVPSERVRLFETDAGVLRGFIWLSPPRGFAVQIDATHPPSPSDVIAMIRWAERHLQEAHPDATKPFAIEAADGDSRLHDVLQRAGYRDTGAADYQLNTQPLTTVTTSPSLPTGAEVRPVRIDDTDEEAARVELHREVWEPSKFNLSGYRRLRTMPIYRPDLDLVAVTPEGALAAYCIVWWDANARTGLFEPVGTAKAHRRKGYGSALLLDALARLRSLGAGTALVISGTDADGAPARGLYESIGFERAQRFVMWERDPE